ncbi:unnamed protein product, partial [marine sediment metagenome]
QNSPFDENDAISSLYGCDNYGGFNWGRIGDGC